MLESPDIRQGIKEYANWPTIPQLYVKGEFVGGSDIVKEMYQSGELQKLLEGLLPARAVVHLCRNGVGVEHPVHRTRFLRAGRSAESARRSVHLG